MHRNIRESIHLPHTIGSDLSRPVTLILVAPMGLV
jgi:hypothetical protein